MDDRQFQMTYIGGPTALLELGGLRLITDPTFDPAGSEYPSPAYTLHKTQAPAVNAEAIGAVDAVLLSHDHHFDNLDRAGRAFLERAGVVFTTPAAAERLGSPAIGLKAWESVDFPTRDGRRLRVTGTPAQHGPADGDRGPVTGFVLTFTDHPQQAVYISGDTVWYEGLTEIPRRFAVEVAMLFMGAARVLEVGPAHLTFNAVEAVAAARALRAALIVPLHYEGWMHFSEGRQQIEQEFVAAGLASRLRWPRAGQATTFDLK